MPNGTVPMGGLASVDTSIPMSNAPTPASAQSVKPFSPVDMNVSEAQAYEVEGVKGEAKSKIRGQQDAERDRVNLQAYLSSGGEGDMHSPEGMKTLLDSDWAQKNLSRAGYDNLAKAYGEKVTADHTLKKMLSDEDPANLENFKNQLDFQAQYITKPAIDAYDQAKEDSGEQAGMKAFETAKAASVKMAKDLKDTYGRPMFTPAKLMAMSAATPDDFKHVYGISKYALERAKTTLDEQLKRASITEKLAQAQKWLADANKERSDIDKVESKTMNVDGYPSAVLFDPRKGKYLDPVTHADISSRVKPLERSGLTAVQMGTVEKDIFEAKKFLEKTDPKGTSSLWFMEQSDKGAIRRFAENKLSTKEQQMYDVYANRLANAIVGMQSLGRYRGAVKSIDEARKLVPVPGDALETIKAKRDYIDEFTRDSDDELSKLSSKPREKLMAPKVPGAGAPAPAGRQHPPDIQKLIDASKVSTSAAPGASQDTENIIKGELLSGKIDEATATKRLTAIGYK